MRESKAIRARTTNPQAERRTKSSSNLRTRGLPLAQDNRPLTCGVECKDPGNAVHFASTGGIVYCTYRGHSPTSAEPSLHRLASAPNSVYWRHQDMADRPFDAVPEGVEFLRFSERNHRNCAVETMRNVAVLPSSVRKTLDDVGTLLSLLDQMASCLWGCRGGSHAIEHLVGRSVSSALASFRLIEMGHYDEAWAITRNVAEVGNLMWLFFVDPDELHSWLRLSARERRSKFRPVVVRERIEAANSVVPHDRDSYSLMSEVGVHPSPENTPHARHNAYGIPTLGGYYQERGFVESLAQLAWAIASVGGPAARMANIDDKYETRIVDLATNLVRELPNLPGSDETTDTSEALLARSNFIDSRFRKVHSAARKPDDATK